MSLRPSLAAIIIAFLTVALAGLGVMVWRLQSRMSSLETARPDPAPPASAPSVPANTVQMIGGQSTIKVDRILFHLNRDKLHERARKDATELELDAAASVRLDDLLCAILVQFGEKRLRAKGTAYDLAAEDQVCHDVDVAHALDGMRFTPAQRAQLMTMEPELKELLGLNTKAQ